MKGDKAGSAGGEGVGDGSYAGLIYLEIHKCGGVGVEESNAGVFWSGRCGFDTTFRYIVVLCGIAMSAFVILRIS